LAVGAEGNVTLRAFAFPLQKNLSHPLCWCLLTSEKFRAARFCLTLPWLFPIMALPGSPMVFD